MAEQNNRYVITGGPGFGKTSIIRRLEELGHLVCHENSREVINEQLAIGGTILPWLDVDKFTDVIVEKRIEAHEKFGIDKPVFFDRGIPDTLAFMYRQDLPVKELHERVARQYQYNHIVFVTPPWYSIFKNDNERRETFAESSIIHTYITKTYADLGYKLIDVPPGDIDERVKFVLDTVGILK